MPKKILKITILTGIFYLFLSIIGNNVDNHINADSVFEEQISSTETSIFPLKERNTWTYKGIAKWTDENNQIHKEEFEWDMNIVFSTSNEKQEIAIVKGHPSDLIWSEKGKDTEKKYSLIINHNNEYYIIYNQELKDLVTSGFEDIDLNSQATKFLPSKIEDLAKFNSNSIFDRYIEVQSAYNLNSLESFDYPELKPSYAITLSTLSDEENMIFSPGVGITHYEYKHDGTVMEVDLDLIDVHFK